MIAVTGAAGFIGSCLISFLNEKGIKDIAAVDEFATPAKSPNLKGKKIREMIHREIFSEWLKKNANSIEVVFHLGARTDTTEQDYAIFEKLNLSYSKTLWNLCSQYQIPFIYASSAATYGDGNLGYLDDEKIINDLKPLNPYGVSKNEFDQWVMQQNHHPPQWAGLKFFNVFGPNEYHKKRMASVVFHTYHQIQATGQMKLFKSHHPAYQNGHQSRDFIYIKDLLNMIEWIWENKIENGLYNIGTGKANTFLDLASFTFKSMQLEPKIDFIDTPEDIRDTYQYYTQAEMAKLFSTGFNKKLFSLEEAIADYVRMYLKRHLYF
jgi:ADP-L-glycero-D-manno-heptose 6-epimerase